MGASLVTKQLIKDAFTDSDGLTKLPGTIVHVPSGGPAQHARKMKWVRKIGQRYVITTCGYREV